MKYSISKYGYPNLFMWRVYNYDILGDNYSGLEYNFIQFLFISYNSSNT